MGRSRAASDVTAYVTLLRDHRPDSHRPPSSRVREYRNLATPGQASGASALRVTGASPSLVNKGHRLGQKPDWQMTFYLR